MPLEEVLPDLMRDHLVAKMLEDEPGILLGEVVTSSEVDLEVVAEGSLFSCTIQSRTNKPVGSFVWFRREDSRFELV